MSISSCYKYVLELPVGSLAALLRAVVDEPEGAGSSITRTWHDVPVPGGFTATVEVRPGDFDATPPQVTLPPADLAMTLTLDMRVLVTINELPDLDAIEYGIHFDLPGMLAKTATVPPELRLGFPGITAPQLNLMVSGGQVLLTPALVENQVHALYDANPALANDVQNGVPWPPGPDTTVQVTTQVFDDDPGSMPYRGSITVTSVTATQLTLHMPGHFKIQGISSTYVNSDMTVDVKVAIAQSDGELRIKLSQVVAGDVTVVLLTPPSNPAVALAAPIMLQNAIANRLRTLAPPPSHDIIQPLPKAADVKGMVESRLVEFAKDLTMPLFSPTPPADPADIDLTAFEPATVGQQALALQFAPRGDGTSCDPPDVFTAAGDGFAIAVADVEVNRMLTPIIEGAKGDRHVQDHDITVERLTGDLADPGDHGQAKGHVWIDGMAEVHVDCWADPDIDFSGPIFLKATKQGDDKLVFEAEAGAFTAEDDCCADVDPATIANLISGEQSTPFLIPTQFGKVGTLDWTPGDVDISKAGVVVHSTLTVTAMSLSLPGGGHGRPYWDNEGPSP